MYTVTKEETMLGNQESALAERALSNIDQLLNNFDHGGQIESALPLLLRHRRTLVQLRDVLRSTPSGTAAEYDGECWVDDLVTAYRQLGGKAAHPLIYRKVKELRTAVGRSWPEHAEEAIRQTLQAHCIESPQYRGGSDLFRMICPGSWCLKVT